MAPPELPDDTSPSRVSKSSDDTTRSLVDQQNAKEDTNSYETDPDVYGIVVICCVFGNVVVRLRGWMVQRRAPGFSCVNAQMCSVTQIPQRFAPLLIRTQRLFSQQTFLTCQKKKRSKLDRKSNIVKKNLVRNDETVRRRINSTPNVKKSDSPVCTVSDQRYHVQAAAPKWRNNLCPRESLRCLFKWNVRPDGGTENIVSKMKKT